jgi:hypothetical protein
MYAIRYDPGDRILHLRLEGFWGAATLAGFTAELLVRTTALRLRGTVYGVLSDSSRFAIQSPLVSQGFERIMARGAQTHRGPTAVVVASVLNKLQAERTLKGDRTRISLDAEEARAWLAMQMAVGAAT